MEVIEKMSDEQYDSVCDAGVELVTKLAELLRRHKLTGDQAFNVFVVAAAGVAAASGLTSNDLAEGVDSVIHMWRVREVAGERHAHFDPTQHVRTDTGPAVTSGN
jgi:hypothetical protein